MKLLKALLVTGGIALAPTVAATDAIPAPHIYDVDVEVFSSGELIGENHEKGRSDREPFTVRGQRENAFYELEFTPFLLSNGAIGFKRVGGVRTTVAHKKGGVEARAGLPDNQTFCGTTEGTDHVASVKPGVRTSIIKIDNSDTGPGAIPGCEIMLTIHVKK